MIKITNTKDSATISIFGDIGQSFFGDGYTFEKFKNDLKGLEVSNLLIEMKSNGGDLLEAFAIHDEIKRYPAKVTARIVGSSASALTVIASAAYIVEITENSRYLVHQSSTFVEGNKDQLQEKIDLLKSFDEQILTAYIKKTGKSKAVLESLMKEERWLTAQEAKDYGFIDRIINITNKIKNMTEEEKAQMEALKAENESLKQKIKELEEAATAMKEEEVEKEVEAAIEAGKFIATAKDSLKELGMLNRKSLTALIENAVGQKQSLKDVPNVKTTPVAKDEKELFAAFKKGEINAMQYTEQLKNLKR
jgi:ATP-dependent protease ClpP protease subunit